MVRSIRHRSAGFSLLEAMVAISLAGVIAATVVATFKGSLDSQARSKHDWQAFTIAQQFMERWASMPRASDLLNENSNTLTPGEGSDLTCSGVPLGERHLKVDELGLAKATGLYNVCVKVTDGSPESSLKNVRVLVEYTNGSGALEHVLLQTVR